MRSILIVVGPPLLDAVAGVGHRQEPGRVRALRPDAVHGTYEASRATLDGLRRAGVDLDEVTALLETQGIAAFERSWDELVASVTAQLERAGAGVMPAGEVRPAGTGTGEGTGPAAAAPRASAREGAHA